LTAGSRLGIVAERYGETTMIGDDWIFGWILDGLAKRFGAANVSAWIVLGIILALIGAGVASAFAWGREFLAA